jgi:hypothetical protein
MGEKKHEEYPWVTVYVDVRTREVIEPDHSLNQEG